DSYRHSAARRRRPPGPDRHLYGSCALCLSPCCPTPCSSSLTKSRSSPAALAGSARASPGCSLGTAPRSSLLAALAASQKEAEEAGGHAIPLAADTDRKSTRLNSSH